MLGIGESGAAWRLKHVAGRWTPTLPRVTMAWSLKTGETPSCAGGGRTPGTRALRGRVTAPVGGGASHEVPGEGRVTPVAPGAGEADVGEVAPSERRGDACLGNEDGAGDREAGGDVAVGRGLGEADGPTEVGAVVDGPSDQARVGGGPVGGSPAVGGV